MTKRTAVYTPQRGYKAMNKRKVFKTELNQEEALQLKVVMAYDHRRSVSDTIRSAITRAFSRIPKEKRQSIIAEIKAAEEMESNAT